MNDTASQFNISTNYGNGFSLGQSPTNRLVSSEDKYLQNKTSILSPVAEDKRNYELSSPVINVSCSSPNVTTLPWLHSSQLRLQVLSQKKIQLNSSESHYQKASSIKRLSSKLFGISVSHQPCQHISGFEFSTISRRILVIGHTAESLEQYDYHNGQKKNLSNVAQLALYLEKRLFRGIAHLRFAGHYFVWNLCPLLSKEFCLCFDPSRTAHSFSESIGSLSWMPPPLRTILELVQAMAGWLQLHESNVIVVICKDGIHRSGLVISSLFYYLRLFDRILDAHDLFIQRRFSHLPKSCTAPSLLPSFKRSMLYFQNFLLNCKNQSLLPKRLFLKQIIVNTIPDVSPETFTPGIAIFQEDKLVYNSLLLELDSLRNRSSPSQISINGSENDIIETEAFGNISQLAGYDFSNDMLLPNVVDSNWKGSKLDTSHKEDQFSHPSFENNIPLDAFSPTENDSSIDSEEIALIETSEKEKYPYLQDNNHIIFHFTDPIAIYGDIYLRFFHIHSKNIQAKQRLFKYTSTVASIYYNTNWNEFDLIRFPLDDIEISSWDHTDTVSLSRFDMDFSIDLIFDTYALESIDFTEINNYEYISGLIGELSSLSHMIGVIPDSTFIESLTAQGIPRILAILSLKIFNNDLFLSHEFAFNFCQQDFVIAQFGDCLFNIISKQENLETEIQNSNIVDQGAKTSEKKEKTSYPCPMNISLEHSTTIIPPMPPPLSQYLAARPSSISNSNLLSPLPSSCPKFSTQNHPPAPPPLPTLDIKKEKPSIVRHKSPVDPGINLTSDPDNKNNEQKRVTKSFLVWKGMSASEINGTIWEDIYNMELESKVNKSSFESFFCVDSSGDYKRPHSSMAKSASDSFLVPTTSILSLIDLRRANNIAIGCSMIYKKYFTPENLIKELYSNSATVTLDDLVALRPLLPTPEEKTIFQLAEKIKSLSPTSPAESFMLAMSSSPSLPWIVDTMIMKKQFDSEYLEIKNLLTSLEYALISLRNSPFIKKILKIILEGCQLAIIEFGRSKTQKEQILVNGATKGFRLSTLTRLSDFRSENGQKSMLHFIAESLEVGDFEELNKLCKIIADSRGTDVSLIRGSIHELKLSIEKAKVGPPDTSDNMKILGFLSSVDTWVTEKNLLLIDLSSQFKALETTLENVVLYFGENPSSFPTDSLTSSSHKINTEEFLKIWDEFLKDLFEANSKLETEKYTFSSTRTGKYRFSSTLNLNELNLNT